MWFCYAIFIILHLAASGTFAAFDSRFRVDAYGTMGITVAPGEENIQRDKQRDVTASSSFRSGKNTARSARNYDDVATARKQYNLDGAMPYDVTTDADFQKVYLEFLRRHLPGASYGLEEYLTNTVSNDDVDDEPAYDDHNDDDDINNVDDETYDKYGMYSDVIVEPTARASVLQSAAKELSEKMTEQLTEKLPKSLSSKCIIEGGTCETFQNCDTTSHIYKGYCATDYSSVCCVPRQRICQANDGICTSDRQACVAAGEIMGRKYNLRFYTWMDCNTTHVCCRPSQAFAAPVQPPPQVARQAEVEDNEVIDNETEAEEDDDDYEDDEVPLKTTRRRKVAIGKAVRSPKGFRGAVNPDFEGFPDDGEEADGEDESPRVVTARRRVASAPRGRAFRRRTVPPPPPAAAQALPPIPPQAVPVIPQPVSQVVPAYGFPAYQQQQQQQVRTQVPPPRANPAPPPASPYTSNNVLYPNIVDYVATYSNTNPNTVHSANTYRAAQYPDQSTLVTQNRLPVQTGYNQGSSAAAGPRSLFGDIFL